MLPTSLNVVNLSPTCIKTRVNQINIIKFRNEMDLQTAAGVRAAVIVIASKSSNK